MEREGFNADGVTYIVLGNTYEMKEELKATRYELSPHDKVQLIKKEDIRLILKRSPDSADALALTFSMPDIPRGIISERKTRQAAFMG
jgi:hypothetical protein